MLLHYASRCFDATPLLLFADAACRAAPPSERAAFSYSLLYFRYRRRLCRCFIRHCCYAIISFIVCRFIIIAIIALLSPMPLLLIADY